MADENQNQIGYDRLWHAYSAARLFQTEDGQRLVGGALEALANDLNLGDAGRGFIEGAKESEQGIKTAIGIYAGMFEESRGGTEVQNLVGDYDGILDGLSDEYKAKLTSQFTMHSGQTLSEIRESMRKAKYISEDPTGTFSNPQKTEAERILQTYKSFIQTLNVLDTYIAESLRPDAVKNTRKNDLEELAKQL